MKFFLLLLVSLLIIKTTFAQQTGILDPTFNKTGIFYNALDKSNLDYCNAMVIQSDGKIILAGQGNNKCALERLDTDGTLDKSFGKNGIVETIIGKSPEENINAIALQPNGKIIVTGDFLSNNSNDLIPPSQFFLLARFNTNGSLDSTFGFGGIDTSGFFPSGNTITATSYSMAFEPDGKIVVGGGLYYYPVQSSTPLIIARYDSIGIMDSTFGIDGIVKTYFDDSWDDQDVVVSSLQIQSDGKIVALGNAFGKIGEIPFVLVRYNIDGSIDKLFGNEGSVKTYFNGHEGGGISCSVQQSDGKIIAGGILESYNANDTDFFAMARYTANGSLDSSFGANGTVISMPGTCNSMAQQPDGKIILAGSEFAGPISFYNYSNGFSMEQFDNNGTIDSTFGMNGQVLTPFPLDSFEAHINAVALQSDGKIVAAGYLGWENELFAAVRYLNNLTLGVLRFSGTVGLIGVYPNPVRNNETLDYTLTDTETLTINLYDIAGRLVKNFITDENETTGEHKLTLNFQSLAAGTYILTLFNSANQKQSVKIIKQ